MRNPDLIITGVSGWLGKRLLRSLIENEVEGVRSILKSSTPAIRVLLEDKSQNIEIDDSNLEKIYGDIRDSSTLKRLFLNTEGATVIHLAGCIHPKIFTKDFMNVNFIF